MKKLTILGLLLMSQTAFAQVNLPINFQSLTTNYGIVPFEGAIAQSIEDPTNPANRVIEVLHNEGAKPWAGVSIAAPGGLASPIAFSLQNRSMSVRVWTGKANTPVRMKLEVAGDPTKSVEMQVNTKLAGQWEELMFNVSDHVPATAAFNPTYAYNMISIFMDFGVEPKSTTAKYYFDDISLKSGSVNPPAALVFPLTFEQTDINWSAITTNFDGGVLSVIDNPSKTGMNTSNKVARMVKGAGQPWGGAFMDAPSEFSIGSNPIFKVKVWSPRANAMMLLKFENATDPTINVERNVSAGVANTWTEVTFDFSGSSTTNKYKKVVVIFDLGSTGNGSSDYTFYFDDIVQVLPTSNEEEVRAIPTAMTLSQNYPNPFNPATSIQFGLPTAGNVELTVMNLLGQKVATVVSGNMSAGTHTVSFDASKLSSGVYLYRLQSGNAVEMRKMTLLK